MGRCGGGGEQVILLVHSSVSIAIGGRFLGEVNERRTLLAEWALEERAMYEAEGRKETERLSLGLV